jgi:argininosuccinate lyase
MKLWQKNYELNKQIEEFTVGKDPVLDLQLLKYDCLASMAHARMLHKIGILSKAQLNLLLQELEHILELDQKGKFKIAKEDEDCHTAIENHLIKICGQAGKMIHTFRSRNDQVLTALRLLYKDRLTDIQDRIVETKRAVTAFKKACGKVIVPGFTHTRKAMPSSIELWAGAFLEAMQDNQKLLDAAFDLIDQSPLGTGAGYGIPFEIDRRYASEQMGFGRVQQNPIYAQSSRGKFEAFILATLSMVLFDINKIASDLILFSMPEFGFFELPDEFLTGSSIMPHKKNPDVLELLRSNYHVVLAYEIQIKSLTANLISGYHRDFQLTKEPALNGLALTARSLAMVTLIFKNLSVNKKKCQAALTSELFATEKAYRLVRRGVPFRDAYKKIAQEFSGSKTPGRKKK